MAYGYIILPLNGAVQADGSGSYNNMPTPAYDVSVGSPPTNTPKVTQFCWDFVYSQQQFLTWSFAMPENTGGGLLLRFKWKMISVNTGNVNFKASSYSSYENATDTNTVIFDPFITSGGVAVPGVVGAIQETSFSLPSYTTAKQRQTVVMFGSEPSGWTAVGTLRLLAVTLDYGLNV